MRPKFITSYAHSAPDKNAIRVHMESTAKPGWHNGRESLRVLSKGFYPRFKSSNCFPIFGCSLFSFLAKQKLLLIYSRGLYRSTARSAEISRMPEEPLSKKRFLFATKLMDISGTRPTSQPIFAI